MKRRTSFGAARGVLIAASRTYGRRLHESAKRRAQSERRRWALVGRRSRRSARPSVERRTRSSKLAMRSSPPARRHAKSGRRCEMSARIRLEFRETRREAHARRRPPCRRDRDARELEVQEGRLSEGAGDARVEPAAPTEESERSATGGASVQDEEGPPDSHREPAAPEEAPTDSATLARVPEHADLAERCGPRLAALNVATAEGPS